MGGTEGVCVLVEVRGFKVLCVRSMWCVCDVCGLHVGMGGCEVCMCVYVGSICVCVCIYVSMVCVVCIWGVCGVGEVCMWCVRCVLYMCVCV